MSSAATNNNPHTVGEILKTGTHRKLKVKWSKNNSLSYEFFRTPLSTSLARLLDVKSFQFFPTSLQMPFGLLSGSNVEKNSGSNAVNRKYSETMKKRFFIIRGKTATSSGSLEYYESERKYKLNQPPKKVIHLNNCLNVNKRTDLKIKNVISLYTKTDCLSIIFDKEDVCNDWLVTLKELYRSQLANGEELRPQFASVWLVNMQKRELGNSKNILGPHLLCLTDRTLTLVKITRDNEPSAENLEFSLSSIRRCGDFSSYLYLEVGQMSVTGAGNLWMEAEDEVIAKNMHRAILNVCANSSRKLDLLPKSRTRSCSANEASKPIEVSRGLYGEARSHFKASLSLNEANNVATSPASVSESIGIQQSANSVGGENVVVHHQRTLSDPLSPLPSSFTTRRASTGNGPNFKRTSTSSVVNNNMSSMRERCDSMPTRARSNTETTHSHSGLKGMFFNRPPTMYPRGVSHSPPIESSPISPPSGGCSTDSAGSSLSMDGEGEPWTGDDCSANNENSLSNVGTGRFSHSITPDAPIIPEENHEEYVPWDGEDAKLNNYMPMNRSTHGSFGLQMQSTSSLSNASYRKYPYTSGYKSQSPSLGSFVDSFSPGTLSPGDQSYTPMSPGDGHDTTDGYVPMATNFGDDGYVNMNSNNSVRKRGYSGSGGSSGSITSGTPSTDLRFSEYHLDKVKSYFTPSEDDKEELRPTRAYSIGSRPEKVKNKNNRLESLEKMDNARVRAFSVGSRPNIRPIIPGKLPSSFVSSSLSSMEQSDDLVELDFSHNSKKKSKKKKSHEHLMVPSAVSSTASSYSTADGSYMDISSPRCSPKLGSSSNIKTSSPDLAPSPPRNSVSRGYVGRSPPKSHHGLLDHHLTRLSPPGHNYYTISPTLHKVSEAPPGYVDMCPGTGGELILTASPPRHISNTITEESNSYVEMKPGGDVSVGSLKKEQTNPRPQNFPTIKPALLDTVGKVPHLNKKQESSGHIANDYIDMDMSTKKKVLTPEDNNNSRSLSRTGPLDLPKQTPTSKGHVEMCWSGKNLEKLSSSNENQDYINMNMSKDKKAPRTNNKPRYSSQPISIQATSTGEDSLTSPVSTSVRKFSTGASPKIPSFLPLGYRSHSRWDSKDSSSSNSSVSTPTNSNSSVFPLMLNSPTSPLQDNYESSSKIPVDGSSGTIRISYPTNNNSSKSLESVQEMDYSSDYVNYSPKTSTISENSDYTVMKPSKVPSPMSRKSSVPANLGTGSKVRMLDKLQKSLTSLSLSSSPSSSNSAMSNKSVNINNNNIKSSSDSNCNSNSVSNVNTPQNQTIVPSVVMTNDIASPAPNTATTVKSAINTAVKTIETAATSVPTATSSSSSSVQTMTSSSSVDSLQVDEKCQLTRQTSSSSGSGSDASVIASTPFFGSIKPPIVSHEKEIQYATLDLLQSELDNAGTKSENGSSSPTSQLIQPTYAEIDFSKTAPLSSSQTSLDSNQRH